MNDVFDKRVRAAAVAVWWTLLMPTGFYDPVDVTLPGHVRTSSWVLSCGARTSLVFLPDCVVLGLAFKNF